MKTCTGIQYKLGSSPYKNVFQNVLVYNNIRGKLDIQVEDEKIKLQNDIGFIELNVERVSSDEGQKLNVLKNDKSIWHAHDKMPYIALKMQEPNEVFMVKVIDRLECPACAGRYEDVEVRVARTPSYEENAVSCGTKSGDGIKNFVYK